MTGWVVAACLYGLGWFLMVALIIALVELGLKRKPTRDDQTTALIGGAVWPALVILGAASLVARVIRERKEPT